MQVVVNGETMELADGLTVRGLVDELGLGPGPIAVERNGEMVPRAAHRETALQDGDVLEVVRFVGGG